ncbi:MAG: DUF3556 domain-containing protein [Myxococcales bacterium]|nr:DUF3556 domain-containing protein [Myxococcales bacterium]MBK7194063.1 DUF3556 domain-containing protein [Myxococcales bacterium]MBP6843655.1 DUF3556 domain-containing protein [Kofleriaceae bacterium]
MGLLDPAPPPYDPIAWAQAPLPERGRAVCQAWAVQGYGTPLAAYGFYAAKLALYVGGWVAWCACTPGLGGLATIGDWWLHPIAFVKAILWSMLFEGLGLGCGSGPLTGRYVPPLGGVLYFARPGTTKRARWPGLPVIGGHRRSWLDVALYLGVIGALVAALASATPPRGLLIAIAIAVPVLGVCDRTTFLAFRGEHYWTTIVVLVAATEPLAGAQAVQLALWTWAGVSKLNHHFPTVVGVMVSNSPVTRWRWLRTRMYRRYPDDLRPSALATAMGHMGTALELGVPLVLGLSDGGASLTVGLVLMLVLHGFITSNVPMGVPLEWNVMVVYGGFALFYAHPELSLADVGPPPLAAALIVLLIGVPLVGNLWPRAVSFLLAMRYYAGNWAYGVWLFKGDSYRKLDRLTKASPWVHDQLARFYDRPTAVGLVGKVVGFRLMHLHGRALGALVPRAIDGPLADYEWVDGELVAGLALGWNFGDGHLHDEGLIAALQAQCGFAPGELRCVLVEAQPIHRPALAWRIVDAATGPIAAGTLAISELRARQPWEGGPVDAAASTGGGSTP